MLDQRAVNWSVCFLDRTVLGIRVPSSFSSSRPFLPAFYKGRTSELTNQAGHCPPGTSDMSPKALPSSLQPTETGASGFPGGWQKNSASLLSPCPSSSPAAHFPPFQGSFRADLIPNWFATPLESSPAHLQTQSSLLFFLGQTHPFLPSALRKYGSESPHNVGLSIQRLESA